MSVCKNAIFDNSQVDMPLLMERSVERWAVMPKGGIPLTAADPDFPPPIEIREALNALTAGKYFPYGGVPGLEESISRGLLERKHESVPPEFIIPIGGAAAGMYATAAAVLEPGDEAIIFDPVDYMFASAIRYAGGNVVYFPSTCENGDWNLEALEEYITPKTKMICLCNPHNPLGLLYSREDLTKLAVIADRHGLWIMNDEVWSDIVYSEKPFVSINSLPKELTHRVITSYGIAKGFSLPGLHAGYLSVMDREAYELVRRVTDGHQYTVSLPSMVGLKAAFDSAFYWVDAFVAHLQQNRDYLCDRLNRIPHISAKKQEATFVSFIDIRGTGMESDAFCDYMLRTQKIAMVPGTPRYFGPGGAGYVRLSYATSRKVLEEAVDRFEKGVLHLAQQVGA